MITGMSNDELQCTHFQGCGLRSPAADRGSLCGKGYAHLLGSMAKLGNVFILKHQVRAYEPKSSIFWTITVLMELY